MIGRHAGAVQCRSACGDSIDRVRYRKPPMLLQYLPRTHAPLHAVALAASTVDA